MKKYRLNYDKLFIVKGGIEGFEYKGEIIEALQIYFEYRVLGQHRTVAKSKKMWYNRRYGKTNETGRNK